MIGAAVAETGMGPAAWHLERMGSIPQEADVFVSRHAPAEVSFRPGITFFL